MSVDGGHSISPSRHNISVVECLPSTPGGIDMKRRIGEAVFGNRIGLRLPSKTDKPNPFLLDMQKRAEVCKVGSNSVAGD